MKLNIFTGQVLSLEATSPSRMNSCVHIPGKSLLVVLCLLMVINLSLSGCGTQKSTSQTESAASHAEIPPLVPPTVSIDAPLIQLDLPPSIGSSPQPQQTAMTPQTEAIIPSRPRAAKGTLEWLMEEIALLQATSRPSTTSTTSAPNEKSQLEPIIVETLDQDQMKRNHTIVELSQQVIVGTHANPEQQSLFNNAVLSLVEARLQLAIAGDSNQARLLNEDAEALFEKNPQSFAATEAAFKLMQFTQIQAQSLAAKDPKWALGFARQARTFSNKFPQETNRAAIHLVAAGRICDKLGLTEEAKNCLMIVEQRFSDSPFADQVRNTLRRLRLPGQELIEFGGSTIDGNYLSIDQFRGRPVIIAFWASNSIVFKEDMALINEVVASFGGQPAVIGVNLDREEAAVERFVTMTNNSWPHIFYSAPNKRGMDNLIAKYYGVDKVPSYWLVDANGIVKSVNLKPTELGQLLSQLELAGN